MLGVGIKSYFACGWSAITYWFGGMPADKKDYFAQGCGFDDLSAPEYAESVAAYHVEPSFHHLKDIGVEWTDAWPQRGFKLTAAFGIVLSVLSMIGGMILGALGAAIVAAFV